MLALGAERTCVHDAGRDEIFQPFGQDIGRQAEAALKVGEPRHPLKHRIPQDEEAPTLTDHLERASGRAVLIFVQPSKHASIVAHLTCIMQASNDTSIMQVLYPLGSLNGDETRSESEQP
jgi:hypothetical protein